MKWSRIAIAVAVAAVAGLTAWIHAVEAERARLAAELVGLKSERTAQLQQLTDLQEEIAGLHTRVREVTDSGSEILESMGLEVSERSGGLGPYGRREPLGRSLAEREKELRRDLWLAIQRLDQDVAQAQVIDDGLRRYVESRAALVASVPDLWPISSGFVISPFGVRDDPFTGQPRMHQGLDIAERPGTPVRATAAGRVVQAAWDGSFGRTVKIDHGFGFATVYAHLREIRAQVGDSVQKGEVVGLLGSSGRTTGPHLHYEIRIEGRPVNPAFFASPRSSPTRLAAAAS